jgi:peptide-methionine (S)-S-oxide reductase
MFRPSLHKLITTFRVLPVILGLAACSNASNAATPLPSPVVDARAAKTSGVETAVLAGGCFWGVEAVFEHVKGVTRVVSGYSGGAKETAEYPKVSSGVTGHAESVQVSYDPAKITYGQLLKVFFSIAHNPTELNRQGPDVGTQYRSSIFYANEEQERVAKAYIAQLEAAKVFKRPIATQVVQLRAFYPAEAYHQDYLEHHPYEPYIVINDLPKLADLQRQFPELYIAK